MKPEQQFETIIGKECLYLYHELVINNYGGYSFVDCDGF